MPTLVLIDTPTVRPGHALGDFVSLHEDGVELGNGMLAFDQVIIRGLDTATIRDSINFKTNFGLSGKANFSLNGTQRNILASIPGVAATKIQILQDSITPRIP